MNNDMNVDAAAAAVLRGAVEYLAARHELNPSTTVLDAAQRRLLADGLAPSQWLRALGAEAGLATATVRRSLADVLADADPSFPWLALRRRGDGVLEVLAVLEGRRGGAQVAIPGSTTGSGHWSRTSLRRWLGIERDDDVVEWILAEPAAPLSGMRSEPGGERLEPTARLRALLASGRSMLWIAVVYSAVIGLLALVVPVTVQQLVNTIAFGSLLQPLAVLVLVVLVALGFSTALNALRAVVVEMIQRGVFARVATDVTWRLLRVRVEAFDRYHGPELVNRFFDTVTVQKSASALLIDGLSILMQTLIGSLLLALYHPWLLAFDVLLIGAMLLIVFLLGRGAVYTAIKESKAKYAMEAWLEQMAANAVTFKSAGADRFATERSHRLLKDWLHAREKHFGILLRQVLGSFALQAAASSALLGIGGWLVINRQLTLGQLVASEIVVTLMMSAFTKFGKQLEVFYDLCAAIDKLGDLVDLPLERSGGQAVLPPGGALAVSMRDVEVRYGEEGDTALSIAALDVAAGERLAITGPLGAGKSTLADALFGLRPAAGSLRIGGVDVRELPLRQLREHIALVRGIELFPASIHDNLRLGREHIPHAEVLAVLEAVGLLDDVQALPQGLDTQIQPHGWPLSTQQALRLMLARAMLGRPRLLILDGVLDQVHDGENSGSLDERVFDPAAPWTLICITQRPELLASCTRVVHVREGHLVEERA